MIILGELSLDTTTVCAGMFPSRAVTGFCTPVKHLSIPIVKVSPTVQSSQTLWVSVAGSTARLAAVLPVLWNRSVVSESLVAGGAEALFLIAGLEDLSGAKKLCKDVWKDDTVGLVR